MPSTICQMTYPEYLSKNPKLTVTDASICAANTGGRLFGGEVGNHATERCQHCGELLHPYPEPTYWMEYPLPQCTEIDGLKFCDQWRREKCATAYLLKHPTLIDPNASKRGAKRNKAGKKPAGAEVHLKDRDAATAAIAATLPTGQDALLSVALGAVSACNEAVLAGDVVAANAASSRYEAAVWKLHGETFLGCRDSSDPKAGGNVIEKHCEAVPGAVPMWGQKGEFLVMVDGVRALVNFNDGWGSLTDCNYSFHAVDLDGPFISETGYLSHFGVAEFGKTVLEAAQELLAGFLKKGRRYVRAEEQNSLAKNALPRWLKKIKPAPMRSEAKEEDWKEPQAVPAGFVQVSVVLSEYQAFLARKWAAEAARGIEAAIAKEKAEAKVRAQAARSHAAGIGAVSAADFWAGRRCEIVEVHNQCFKKDIGKVVVVVSAKEELVWAHDDRPITYRKNRGGKMVVASDPKCIQTVYSMKQLRAL